MTNSKLNIPSLCNPNNEHVDCIIITIPLTITSMPLMAPATLKPVVNSLGLSCKTIDLNNDIHRFVTKHPLKKDLVNLLDTLMYTNRIVVDIISDIFNDVVNSLLSFTPSVICISLLTFYSQNSAKWIIYLLKKLNSDITIIAGGAGCMDSFVGTSSFIKTMLETKQIDYHIRGDGEQALYEALKGNYTYFGINDTNWKQISQLDLSRLPMPDYSDYDFKNYTSSLLPILGSRGCVRKCQYCDYIENWKKFTWRDADDVFNEMRTQYEKYGIRAFKFQDSLVNGNLLEFNKLLENIAYWNEENPNKSFSWGGFYIFRSINKNSDHEWELIKKSNAGILTVGIENLNEDIRTKIGKKFSNEAIDYHLEKALELNITVSLLFIVGYVTETYEHIEFAKEWLRTHTKYINILHLKWGRGLSVLPDTYLFKHREELGIQMSNKADNWVDLNTGHTKEQRLLWIKELNQLSSDLGYTVRSNYDDHYLLEELLNKMNYT